MHANTPSRLWLLTTLMALYTLHVRTIPSLRRRLPSDAATGETLVHPSQPERESRKALTDAEWTNRKLLADLVFVCECECLVGYPHPQLPIPLRRGEQRTSGLPAGHWSLLAVAVRFSQ